MTNKIWNGAAWKEFKNLRIWNGSAWKDATKGWVWNGAAWKQFYPEYPVNTTAPTISGNATQGNLLTVTDGTWKGFPSDKAFAYTSTAYQWLRNGSNISGATGNQYATTVSDVGTTVSCRVTVSNQRGPTPIVSSNSITVTSALPGAPSNLSITNGTTTPGTFTVSTSSSAGTTASGSWTSSSSATSYSASTSAGNISADTGARTFSISGGTSGNSYTVTITAFNTSGVANLSWTGGSNATSYDIYINGAYWTNTVNTSIAYSWGTTGSLSVNVRSKNSVGAESTGVSGSATISAASRQAQASSTFYALIPTISNVTNSNKTDSSVTISWNSTNQSNYSISGVGSWNGTTAISQAVTGLSASTTYTATVTVTSSTGQTTSGSTTFTTSAASVIPTITNLTFTNVTNTSANISWQSTNQSTYSISGLPASYSGNTATTRTPTGLTAGTTYNVTVTVASSTNNTASESGSFTTTGGGGGSAPAVPTGLTAYIYEGCGYSTGFWNSVSGATSYEIYYSASTTNPGSPTVTGIDTTYYSGPESGATYWWVRARNASGVSNWSARATAYLDTSGSC